MMSLSFFTKEGRPHLTNDVCIPLSLQYSLLVLSASSPTLFASTPKSIRSILRQCGSLIPSLKALNDSFSMNDMPSTRMLLHFAPNYTLFTSLPLTIGLTYALLMLAILSLTLSRGSLFSKWFFCWRYILVMISMSLFLTVCKLSAPCSPYPVCESASVFSP